MKPKFKKLSTLFTILFFILSLQLIVINTSVAQTIYEFSGTIYEGTGAKIPDVVITAYDAVTGIEEGIDTTDGEGFYSILLEAGTYDLTVTPPPETGYEESRIDGLVITGDTIQNIVLIPKAIQLSGTVMTNEGIVIPYAQVRLFPSSGQGIEYNDNADENGYYEISLTAGTFDLYLNSQWSGDSEHIPTYISRYIERDLSLTQNTERDIVVEVVKLSGIVTDTNAVPVSSVNLQGSGSGKRGRATSGGDGRYTMALVPGTYTIYIYPPEGSGFVKDSISGLGIQIDTTLDIVLKEAIQLSGTVMTNEGIVIPYAQVRLFPSSGQGIEYNDNADENGYYEISLTAGTFDLYLNSQWSGDSEHIPTYISRYIERDLSLTQNTERDIVVEVVKLSGIVTDTNAVPVSSVNLQGSGSGKRGRATSGGDGRYTMALVPGTYTIYIYPPEGSGFVKDSISGLGIQIDTTLDIVLKEAIQLSGTVMTNEGIVIPYAQVRLFPSSGQGIEYNDNADENGYYEISLTAGTFDLYLNSQWSGDSEHIPTYISRYIERDLSLTQNTERDIVVEVVKLSGIVTDTNAVPVSSVNLQGSGSGKRGRATSGGDGRYTMALVPGTYTIYIYPPQGSGFVEASIPGMAIETNIILVVILQLPDTVPPKIVSGPEAIDITDTTASISWLTNELSDSLVDYGIDTSLGMILSDPPWVVNHVITLIDLSPNTHYFYRVSSTDRAGNGPTQSDIFSFTTLAAPDINPPVIIFGPEVLPTITDSKATVHWITDEASNSYVFFGKTENLNNVEGSGTHVSDHYIDLSGLDPDTIYYYMVASTDPSGNGPTESPIYTFKTRAAPDTDPPIITSGPTVLPTVTNTSAQIVWTTDEISDSGVSYNDGTNYYVLHNDDYLIEHMMTLANLQPDTLYYFTVSSKDPSGNGPTLSETLTFRTLAAPETDPPAIVVGPLAKNITFNSAMIEWETDEISDGKVYFGTDTLLGSSIIHVEDLILHQLVITNLIPDTTYYYKVSSTDPSGNGPTESQIFSFTTLSYSENLPPVAVCQDVTIPTVPGLCSAVASVDAGCFDPDGDPVTIDQSPPGSYDLGTTEVTLTVTDDKGLSDSCNATISVADIEAPVLNCSASQVIECTGIDGAVVTFNNTAVDNCTEILLVSCDHASGSIFPLGSTSVFCEATDESGNTSSCEISVTVQDTTTPVISWVSANPNELWPPNHKMNAVSVEIGYSDSCDPDPVCQITSVASNEPINGTGDGDTEPDWVFNGDLTVDLRAERSGSGDGRVYTITVECTDESGNTSTSDVTVTVPHDKGKKN